LLKYQLSFLAVTVLALASCGSGLKRTDTLVAPTVAIPRAQPAPLPVEAPRSIAPPPIDPVDALIREAESFYDAGMKEYREGNLEKAKDKFDQALAVLLESNLDFDSDRRLGDEFNKLLEDIHGVELAALERGDTLAEHSYEAPPIESFAKLTFPVDPRVKQHVQEEMKSVQSDLPLVSNDYVDGVITFLQNHGRKYMETVIQRSGLYGPLISQILKEEGLPQDLIYVAAGESSFYPHALSRAGAVGIWQFMLGTGSLYGLRRDRWVDDREDPVKSTRAAARHLKRLYGQFGDWYLAMAAYDWGSEGLQRAIERTGYADFWSLRRLHALPNETENYVPIFLATALIAKDPKAYGFDVSPLPPISTEDVVVSVPTDLRLVADLIDHPVDELAQLNPSILQWSTPADNPQFVLHLPAGTKENLENAIAMIPAEKRMWWRAHRVEAGETLSAIAHKYRLAPVALAQANQVKEDEALIQGVHLLLPYASGDDYPRRFGRPGNVASSRTSTRLYQYHVRSGDTIDLIADRFDVSAYDIRRWNRLPSSRLAAGRVLKLYVHSSPVSAGPGARRTGSPHAARTRTANKRTVPAPGVRQTKVHSEPAASSASRNIAGR
jgi:membrane-bound lytic murein transglycosylase D